MNAGQVTSVARASTTSGLETLRSNSKEVLQTTSAPQHQQHQQPAVKRASGSAASKPAVALALDDDEDHPELVQMMIKADAEAADAATLEALAGKHAVHVSGSTSSTSSQQGDDEEEDGDARPDTSTPKPDSVPVEQLTEEELRDRILKQVDFYFGDANFPKDKYLRKQARLDPTNQDWVSLDVVTHYKKIKKLTSDPAVVAAAVATSTVVILSNDRTKLRRVNPIPKDVEDTLARTVVLENLPRKTTEAILKAVCEGHGAVAAVRIFDPSSGAELPEDIKQMLEIGQQEGRAVMHSALQAGRPPVGLVEYQTHNDANKACKSLAVENEWARTLRVTRLYKKEKELQGQQDSASASASDSEKKRAPRSRSRNHDDEASESGRSSGRSMSPYMDIREEYRPRAHSAGIAGSSSSNWRQVTAPPAMVTRDRAVSLGRRAQATLSASGSAGAAASSQHLSASTGDVRSAYSSAHSTPHQVRKTIMTPTSMVTARSSPLTIESGTQQQQQQQQQQQTPQAMTPAPAGSSSTNWRCESPALRSASPMLRQADSILRMPKGPEAGKGFTALRRRVADV